MTGDCECYAYTCMEIFSIEKNIYKYILYLLVNHVVTS